MGRGQGGSVEWRYAAGSGDGIQPRAAYGGDVRGGEERSIAAYEAAAYGSRVKLSVKSDYAARAVLGLARHYPKGSAVRVEELAVEYGIPANYLIQILIELKSKQIVKSQRGKEGGYLLARSPAEISMGDVIRAIHGHVFDSAGLLEPGSPPELRSAWAKLREALESAADAITFQQLMEEGQEREKMYYI